MEDSELASYSKANLGNLVCAFAGLHVLETAFLDAVGTRNDLESFANKSNLFNEVRFATTEDISKIFDE